MESPAKNTRTGLAFFASYFLLYTVFVLVSAFAPSVLERQVAGVNLAILSGFGLILGAIGLAVIYCWVCRESQE